MMNKKGLSPVIATSLLVAIAVVLALIIFMWARSFIGEVLQKDGSPIEEKCKEITFAADVSTDGIIIENTGNIPIYGVELKKTGFGTSEGKGIFERNTIGTGQTGDLPIPSGITLESDDEVQVIPIIVGEAGNAKKEYSCVSSGITAKVL